jgi:DNA invertase Pin-like site-specific DNA recombinase
MQKRFVSYYRVSTKRQGESGLGLDAQKEAVRRFIGDGDLVAEFQEVESGGRDDRPALEAALRECRLRRATLVIAKLDRLARSVAFISRLMEDKVDFVAVDLPHANTFTVHVMAASAEFERKMISERTVAALAAAKARGVRLGGKRAGHDIRHFSGLGRSRSIASRQADAKRFADDTTPVVRQVQAEGTRSLAGIADSLNLRGIPAPRGGSWSANQVRRLMTKATPNP